MEIPVIFFHQEPVCSWWENFSIFKIRVLIAKNWKSSRKHVTATTDKPQVIVKISITLKNKTKSLRVEEIFPPGLLFSPATNATLISIRILFHASLNSFPLFQIFSFSLNMVVNRRRRENNLSFSISSRVYSVHWNSHWTKTAAFFASFFSMHEGGKFCLSPSNQQWPKIKTK